MKTINIEPDGPAILANRIVRRLAADGLLGALPKASYEDSVSEVIADEIHKHAIEVARTYK